MRFYCREYIFFKLRQQDRELATQCTGNELVGTSKWITNDFFIGVAWFPKHWGKVVRWSPKVSPIGLPFQRILER